jgi:hypothetical protein
MGRDRGGRWVASSLTGGPLGEHGWTLRTNPPCLARSPWSAMDSPSLSQFTCLMSTRRTDTIRRGHRAIVTRVAWFCPRRSCRSAFCGRAGRHWRVSLRFCSAMESRCSFVGLHQQVGRVALRRQEAKPQAPSVARIARWPGPTCLSRCATRGSRLQEIPHIDAGFA